MSPRSRWRTVAATGWGPLTVVVCLTVVVLALDDPGAGGRSATAAGKGAGTGVTSSTGPAGRIRGYPDVRGAGPGGLVTGGSAQAPGPARTAAGGPSTTAPRPPTTAAPHPVPPATTSSTTTTSGPPPPNPLAAIPLGVFTGASGLSGAAEVAAFGAATGTHPRDAADYLPGGNGWAQLDGSAGNLASTLQMWHQSGLRLVLAVPIIPTAKGVPVATLQAGAAGSYNSYFTTLARTLVAGGEGNAILRPGWEFDGSWYPWAVSDATSAGWFAAYFRNIVTSMRSVPGAQFLFDWNPSGQDISGKGWTIDQAYPGDASVDLVGIDVFDETWQTPQTPQVCWNSLLTGVDELDWLAAFGAAHNKPLTIPEWAETVRSDGHGLGDDPSFVVEMAFWILSHDVAFTVYFNADESDGTHNLSGGDFPQALGTFRKLFG